MDDVAWCRTVINAMLCERGMKALGSIAEYHRVFCFPIVQYYQNVGFDFAKETFEALAQEYVSRYYADKSGRCKLHQNAERVLKTLQGRGLIQIILSASKTDYLLAQTDEFDIARYFEEMLGISDIYAKSKMDVGMEYMARKKAKNALLIGDTTHDFEVARALGADCLLIAKGHQSKEALILCDVPVLDDIAQAPEYIL